MSSANMKILIACVGNIFQGDDAFGCEVAEVLSGVLQDDDVSVVDFGIRGLDLAYALMDPWDLTILVDTVSRDGPPGTVYTIEPDLEDLEDTAAIDARAVAHIDAHVMDPVQVLRSVKAMGVRLGRILLVGCEPGDLGGEEGRMGLTPAVAAAVYDAASVVESLIAKEREEVNV